MATRAAHKRLTREYAALSANPPEYITALPSENNILEWHYVLTGPPDTPYTGGQYWGTLVFPSDYPFAPPAIRMHTPSGRFRCSERLCLSISDFHPKSFNPAWEVSTILLGVLSFMTSEEMTTGSISGTDAERRAFAAKTRWWNSTGGGSTTRKLKSQRLLSDATSSAEQSNSNARGFGAIKAGDGGKRFREHFPELDEQNWKWMEDNQIDPRTGASLAAQRILHGSSCAPEAAALRRRVSSSQGQGVVEGARGVRNAGQGWLTRNKWYLIAFGLFAYVLVARVIGDQAARSS